MSPRQGDADMGLRRGDDGRSVIPAEAGIQRFESRNSAGPVSDCGKDPRRRDDETGMRAARSLENGQNALPHRHASC